MKHYVLTIALAALSTVALFTGCSSDDDFDAQQEQTAQSGQTPIGFGSYLNRSVSTRGTAYLEPADIALNGHVGLFSMHTEGGKYGSTANGGTFPNFTANLMNNVELKSSLTEDELQSVDAKVADSWVYSPLRYWPLDANDYVSFMAYAPYDANQKLVSKDGKTTGDLTYIQHTVANDPKDQIDLLYADPTDIANMQLYPTKSEKGFYNDGTNVDLKFKHATSRIGFVVTSSALKSPYNYGQYIEGQGWWWFGNIESGLAVEVYTSLSLGITITVNKVEFLGNNSSAEATNPTGTFTPSAYLNLASTNDNGLWSNPSQEGKLAFTYDNTAAVRTVSGEVDEKGESSSWQEGSVTGVTGKNVWIPDEKITEEDIKYIKEQFKDYPQWYIDAIVNYYENYTPLEKTITGSLPPKDGAAKGWKDEAEVYPVGNASDDYMFVIPQDFSKDNADGNSLWVYLDYTVNYVDGVSGEVEKDGINYKVYRKINQKFEPGKAYIVVMDIGKKDENGTSLSFNSVNFSVQLDDWADEEKATATY